MATILVVDDEPDIRLLVRFTLALDGHQVVEASDGAEALAAVAHHRPDLIVLDVMMPEVSGWDALTTLKGDDDQRVREIPVIMLTALSSPLDEAKGGIEGAVRYLTKPITPDDLRAAVADALSGDPEPVKRRRVRREALESIARIESGRSGGTTTASRTHFSALEAPKAPARASKGRDLRPLVAELTDKQRLLLEGIRSSPTVMAAAESLGMSRSNVYASLRRIARRLDVHDVSELLDLVRGGHVV